MSRGRRAAGRSRIGQGLGGGGGVFPKQKSSAAHDNRPRVVDGKKYEKAEYGAKTNIVGRNGCGTEEGSAE